MKQSQTHASYELRSWGLGGQTTLTSWRLSEPTHLKKMLVKFDDFPQVIRVENRKKWNHQPVDYESNRKIDSWKRPHSPVLFFLSLSSDQFTSVSWRHPAPKKKRKVFQSLSLYVLYTGRYIHTNLTAPPQSPLTFLATCPSHLGCLTSPPLFQIGHRYFLRP